MARLDPRDLGSLEADPPYLLSTGRRKTASASGLYAARESKITSRVQGAGQYYLTKQCLQVDKFVFSLSLFQRPVLCLFVSPMSLCDTDPTLGYFYLDTPICTTTHHLNPPSGPLVLLHGVYSLCLNHGTVHMRWEFNLSGPSWKARHLTGTASHAADFQGCRR
jgi:hypothetical protein